jgi:hypothetical protein
MVQDPGCAYLPVVLCTCGTFLKGPASKESTSFPGSARSCRAQQATLGTRDPGKPKRRRQRGRGRRKLSRKQHQCINASMLLSLLRVRPGPLIHCFQLVVVPRSICPARSPAAACRRFHRHCLCSGSLHALRSRICYFQCHCSRHVPFAAVS